MLMGSADYNAGCGFQRAYGGSELIADAWRNAATRGWRAAPPLARQTKSSMRWRHSGARRGVNMARRCRATRRRNAAFAAALWHARSYLFNDGAFDEYRRASAGARMAARRGSIKMY